MCPFAWWKPYHVYTMSLWRHHVDLQTFCGIFKNDTHGRTFSIRIDTYRHVLPIEINITLQECFKSTCIYLAWYIIHLLVGSRDIRLAEQWNPRRTPSTVTSDVSNHKLLGWPVIVNIQHSTPLSMSHVNARWMFETFIKLILHIKEMVWCFVLDGSPRSHTCMRCGRGVQSWHHWTSYIILVLTRNTI